MSQTPDTTASPAAPQSPATPPTASDAPPRATIGNPPLPVGKADIDTASPLSPIQQRALASLAGGASIRDAASEAGIDRRTLHRWLREDAQFAAAFNSWRRELLDSSRARALAMTDRALAAIDKAIDKGDARLAMQLVRGLGVLDQPRIGNTDPNVLRQKIQTAQFMRLWRASRANETARWKLGFKSQVEEFTVMQIDSTIRSFQELREKALKRETPAERQARLKQEEYDAKYRCMESPLQRYKRLKEEQSQASTGEARALPGPAPALPDSAAVPADSGDPAPPPGPSAQAGDSQPSACDYFEDDD